VALVDTHCHLGSERFPDRAEVARRAWEAGVAHVVVVGESPAALEACLALATDEPRISVVAGLHPHDAAEWTPEWEARLRDLATDPRVVALGEMGLDYHYDHAPRPVQREVFARQLAIAVEVGLPAVIHAREADDDVAAVLREQPRALAVLHSFSSGAVLLEAGLALGHYVSFSGMVTFRNWELDSAVRAVPPERLLLETDAPFLAPVPHRGKRNEPAFVRYVAERLAAVRDLDPVEVMAQTGRNAASCFGARVAASLPGARLHGEFGPDS
jgi:TatD DNase family protein